MFRSDAAMETGGKAIKFVVLAEGCHHQEQDDSDVSEVILE
jgi:hypothetical protein